MRNRFNRRLYLLFGAWTLLIVVAVVAILLIFHFDTIRTQVEDDAAVATTRVLAPALQREAADLESFTSLARVLLSDQVRSIRLWSSDGTLLASAGEALGAAPNEHGLDRALDGFVDADRLDAPGGDILVSYAPLGGAVLEVQQDYAPVAASVTSSRRILLLSVATGAIVLLLLVQAMLWATTHDLKREYERLAYLHRSGQAMRSTLDLSDVLVQLARNASLYTRAQLALVTLVEEKSDDLLVTASYDRDANSTAQHHRKVEEWYMRRSAATGETVQAELNALPYGALLGYEPKRQGPVAVLCVAIPGHDQPMGIVTVVRSLDGGKFASPEVSMVEELTAQAAMAVEQAILFTKMRSYADQVELSYDSTLKVLMAALDTKDSATQGHSERVSRLTVALAKELGVPQERLVDIERGALLHDVGKIGVPDEVLQKPDTLNEGEWEAMQKHPLLAGLMVSKVGFLEGALPILLYHHERYDGSGYPFGLEGKTIPLEARIFAVVDAYDAMTSDRPYREAMSHLVALGEIQKSAGSQFDPEIVQAFTDLMARERPKLSQAA